MLGDLRLFHILARSLTHPFFVSLSLSLSLCLCACVFIRTYAAALFRCEIGCVRRRRHKEEGFEEGKRLAASRERRQGFRALCGNLAGWHEVRLKQRSRRSLYFRPRCGLCDQRLGSGELLLPDLRKSILLHNICRVATGRQVLTFFFLFYFVLFCFRALETRALRPCRRASFAS